MVKDRAVKSNNGYTFADFSYGLYLLDTPRPIPYQLGSLALIDGRNVWAEKSALVPQYGYTIRATLPPSVVTEEGAAPAQIKAFSKGDTANNDFYILANEIINEVEQGVVYLLSSSEGLKKFKTTISGGFTENPILTRRGKDICLYDGGVFRLFGGLYTEQDSSSETGALKPVGDTVKINDIVMNVFPSYGEFSVSVEDGQYYWIGKQLWINNRAHTVISAFTSGDDTKFIVRVIATDNESITSGNTAVYEATTYTPVLTFEFDNTGVSPAKQPVTIIPRLMAVSNNRLFVEHVTGDIFYSAIGTINEFRETQGAGYFGGFYNDTTNLLAIEEFLDGSIVVKENGFYYLTIGDTLEVKKISQVGQKYASDHVIVDNKIFAYDSNSGALVSAVGVNAFGVPVAGKTLVSSEYLNAQNFNINSSKRNLVYNAEARILILYYGADLRNGIVYTIDSGSLFPRELDLPMLGYIGFNQGVAGISETGEIIQDFKKGTIIPNLTCIAVFEPIGLRDNRCICASMLEITELNGINYTVSTENVMPSVQKVQPSFYVSSQGDMLLPFLYSDGEYLADSFELTSRWAEQTSHVTRLYAPMSGRGGISLTLEFESDRAFCLNSIRIPDFAQGN